MRSCPRRRDRLRPWRLGRIGALLALAAVVLTATLAGRTANSAFTATATNPGNRAGSATLNPVTGLTATPTCSAGAAPTHVANRYNFSDTSGSSSARPTVPSNTQPGDLIMVHILRNSASPPTPPSGWAQIRGDTASNSIGSWVYQRVATASDPGTMFTWTVAGTSGSWQLSTYRGAAGLTLAGESSGRPVATSGRTAIMESVPAATANSLLVFLIAHTGTMNGRTVGGMATLYEVVSANAAFRAYSEIRTQTGATGQRSVDLGTDTPRATAGLLIRPAPPAVNLSWTASPSTFADGYQVRRNGVVVATLAGRSATTWTDSAASAGSHTWSVVTTAQSWRSASASVTASSSC